MSLAYTTNNMLKKIQARVMHTSYTQAKLIGWFNGIGNVLNIGEGLVKYTTTTIEKMEPGEVLSHLSAIPNNVPVFSEQTTTLMTLGAKIVIPMQVLDQWRNNNLINIDLQDILNEQMKSMLIQVDQVLAYGDAMKTPRTGDKKANEARFLGIFNGGTTFGAGDGADDNMTAAGDYQSTVSNAIKALKNAGHESSRGYYMFSDVDTYHQAELGVHQLNTFSFTNERKAIDANKDIIAWIDSPNFINAASESRIVITNPFTNPDPKAKDGSEFAYRLLQGYNFKVLPLNGGSINSQMAYEYAVVWSGVVEFINAEAVQSSGALTLT